MQTIKAVKSKKDKSVMAWLPSGQAVFWSSNRTKTSFQPKDLKRLKN